MALVNLLDVKPNKVSTNLKDYSMLIFAPSGYGKTPFLFELFGEEALFLAYENSQKGIAGIHAVDIDCHTTLEYYLSQLENPLVREKYDVVVIDTLFLFDACIENAITDTYGKDLLSDCLDYNKAYKIVDKKFVQTLKRIQRMNYNIVYVCHPSEKKVKIGGKEYVKIEPKVSDRIKNILLPEVDIKIYCGFDENGKRVIYTQSSPYWDARVRVGDMDPVIPFDVESFKKAFKEGIERRVKNSKYLVENLEKKNIVSDTPRDFKVAMQELISLGEELEKNGSGPEAVSILNKELGTDSNGKQRTLQDLNESMIGCVETIIVKLKALKEKQ